MTIDGALVMALARCETENEHLRKMVADLEEKVKQLESAANGEAG